MTEKTDTEEAGVDEELQKGIKVEMEEHGMDEAEATKTATDHIAEDPMYYSKLEEMEGDTESETTEPLDNEMAEEESPELSISVLARKNKPNFAKKR